MGTFKFVAAIGKYLCILYRGIDGYAKDGFQKVGEQCEFKMMQLFEGLIYFKLKKNGSAKDDGMESFTMTF